MRQAEFFAVVMRIIRLLEAVVFHYVGMINYAEAVIVEQIIQIAAV